MAEYVTVLKVRRGKFEGRLQMVFNYVNKNTYSNSLVIFVSVLVKKSRHIKVYFCFRLQSPTTRMWISPSHTKSPKTNSTSRKWIRPRDTTLCKKLFSQCQNFLDSSWVPRRCVISLGWQNFNWMHRHLLIRPKTDVIFSGFFRTFTPLPPVFVLLTDPHASTFRNNLFEHFEESRTTAYYLYRSRSV